MTCPARLWLISESYFPDEAGTAFYMTRLAEKLAREFTINVLCGYPVYDGRGSTVGDLEMLNGVRIKRCRGTTFNKDVFILRIVNLVTVSIATFFNALMGFGRNDMALVVTNPPLLPFMIKLACWLRGAKCILRIDDVYPEVLMATGHLSAESFAGRVIAHMNNLLYRSVDQIVVLGRDMKELADNKVGPRGHRAKIIPNWADLDEIRPAPKDLNPMLLKTGLVDKFVVLCAGNMGRAQAIENMLRAVELLKNRTDIHFLFVGSGAKKRWMQEEAAAKDLRNITFIDQKPRSEQQVFLNACDIVLISLLPGMTGAGVPSRLYNAMAAGKPVISFATSDSEVSRVVYEENIGWIAGPDDPGALLEAILNAKSNPERLAEMGRRARMAVENRYSRDFIINEYVSLLKNLSCGARSLKS